MGDERTQQGQGLVVEEAQPRTKRPPLYQVVLLNDDYTPMEFVVDVLEHIFAKPPAQAMEIMLNVHHNGVGLAGVFAHEVAESKIDRVHTLARKAGFPLRCSLEPE